MKICPRCKKIKPSNEFTKNANTLDRLGTYCKACAQEYNRRWRKRTGKKYHNKYDPERARIARQKPEAIARRQAYYRTPEYREKARARYYKNRKKRLAYAREYYETHKRENREAFVKYYYENKIELMKKKREYRHTPAGIECTKRHNLKKKKSGYASMYKWMRKHDGTIYAKMINYRDRTNRALRDGYTKKSRAYKFVGCDWQTAHEYLLNTWKDKYGTEWNGEPFHIDHVTPVSTAKTEEELINLLKLENTRMVKPIDNLRKNKLDEA